MSWIKVASPAPLLLDPQINTSCPGVKLKALDKAKILREAAVKVLPFTNRKQT